MILERDPPVNWKHTLLELRRRGWTLRAIAFAINVAPSTLQRWWDGDNPPPFEEGRAILKLLDLVKKNAIACPRVEPSSSNRAVQSLSSPGVLCLATAT